MFLINLLQFGHMKTLSIRVLPRSSRNEIVGEMADGTLKVKLTAPPVDGKANRALIELLSEYFDVPKSKIKIVRGLTSKNKIIEIKN
ncbi:MAG: YggU family protein [Candidatus Magasanikbacteria bacterium RIFOXYC2_FULL_39_8]|nr:MAG: YggU family protein [Candidatus Magasanikbacteria bacterium RIFOXYC2_FULL_39_8]